MQNKDNISQNNVCSLARNLADCTLSLQTCGANQNTVQWIIQNTGLAWAFCGHLAGLRENGIEEHVIDEIVYSVFPAPGAGKAGAVDEYSGVCLDRRNGRFALAENVPAEHRAALTAEAITAIRFHLNNGR
jgi:hypothetical protein